VHPKRSTDIDVRIGARLRAARIEQSYPQEYIAGELDISFQQIQKYEKGVNRVSVARLAQFCEHYQKPLAWFLAGSEFDPTLRGEPSADLGALMLGTTSGRRFAEAYLAVEDEADRAVLLLLAERLASRSTAKVPQRRAA
jgi:transcriptional regulator with XRE-family HTH domain